jgi:hypothetical protein
MEDSEVHPFSQAMGWIGGFFCRNQSASVKERPEQVTIAFLHQDGPPLPTP